MGIAFRTYTIMYNYAGPGNQGMVYTETQKKNSIKLHIYIFITEIHVEINT